VQAKARERIREYVAEMVDPDRVLQEAARLAMADVRALYDEDGKIKPMKDWPDDLAAAVGGFEVVKGNVDKGDGQYDQVVKLKVWEKTKALEMLFKHLNLYAPEQHEHKVTVYKWQS
jgi:phage terminase small subunit